MLTANHNALLNAALTACRAILRDPGPIWDRLTRQEQAAVSVVVDALWRLMREG